MRVLVRIQNVNTYVEGDSFPRSAVDEALSYYTPGFFMAPRYRDCPKCKKPIPRKFKVCPRCRVPRVWDGKKHLLLGGKFGTPYFPTGLLPIVARILTEHGLEAIYRDERAVPSTTDPNEAHNVTLSKWELWQEQKDAIFAALTYERGIIQTPTGGGKTTIISGIAKLISEPTVVVINNTSIASQLRTEISEMLNEDVGLIKGGTLEIGRVTVAMTQSLYGGLALDKESKDKKIAANLDLLDLVRRTRTLILDEAHHGSATTWYDLCKQFIQAYYRFGVTGTAFMRPAGDDLLLMGATGGLIYEVPEQQLIAKGYLAQPIIHFYKIDAPSDIWDVETYQKAYEEGVVNNIRLNQTAAECIKNLWKEQQILVLCERLEHIQNLCKLLKDVEYEVLTGDSPDDEREEVKEKFMKGKVKVIIATKIFDEGVSINNIDVVIRMGLMKTPIKTKQQVGRGQRSKKGKPNVVHIIDFLHTTNEYLAKHSTAHFNDYARLGYPMNLRTQAITTLDCQEAANAIQSSVVEGG
jgi:superfamily II DNA or RNA helicase